MESQLFLQEDLYARITKAKSNFKKTPKERITQEYIEGRLDNLNQLWNQFMTSHKELICTSIRKDLLNTDYFKNEIYDKAEESYLDLKCELKASLCKFKSSLNSCGKQSEVAKMSHIKLPKICISQFSGQYSEWCTFRDLFQSLVHQNNMLDNVQKLHYLKSYLVGEAEQILRHIPITSENYERCWRLLEERYNNKKYICHHILKRFFSQRNIVNESAGSLKDLIDTSNDCLAALSNLGIDVKSWDVIIVYILTLKLDSESRRQWEFNVTNSNTSDELHTYEQFKEFLTNRYRAMEFLDSKSNPGNSRNQPSGSGINRFKTLYTANLKCPFCSEEHRLYVCKLFLNESVENRRKFVQENNICFVCLGSNHTAKGCTYKGKCRVCKRNHHTFLHPSGGVHDTAAVNCAIDDMEESVVGEAPEAGKLSSNDPLVSCLSTGKVYSQVLLATAVVNAKSRDGQSYPLRALLDQGSQSSFITESTVQYLRLRKIAVTSQISGLGSGKNIVSKAKVNIEVTSRVDPKVVFTVSAYVLKSITTLIPTRKVDNIKWHGFEDIQLADPNYHTPSRIDLLLGAEVYGRIIQSGLKRGPNGSQIAQCTSLGWILSGVVDSLAESSSDVHVLHCIVDDNELLKKFWEIEADPSFRKKVLTDDEQRCEKWFSETTRRDNKGKYIVRLPLKSELPVVQDSKGIAEKRLLSLERRLNKNETLKQRYTEVMKEYLSLDHMELVPPEEIYNPCSVYLPQHVVIRDDKETTQIRVVCDASCKGSNNMSLNDYLLIGPGLQPELRHLVMRWRVPVICLAADIVKMYRQVRVNSQDSDLQRILWRPHESSDILHYRLTTVTFGTASAPYLAVRALQQLSVDEAKYYPKAAERVITDFYMDDLLTGCEDEGEGMQIYEEMKQLLNKGGFTLQKWTSNSNELLEKIKEKESINEGLKIKADEVIKIVGLTWNRTDDTFRYTVNLPATSPPETKRKILSNISKFYDPLGWAGPSIILAKILIQKLWLAGLDWDEPVTDQISKEWSNYWEELKALTDISVPRWLGTTTNDIRIELHGFCDASKIAYAAVVYIRTIDKDGKVHVGLVSAKTKVGPVKQISIPRMELCGAVLLVRLLNEIADVLKIEKHNIHAWTDSTIVLAWLNSHPNRWKVFVANRVTEIQMNLDAHHWGHICSDQNPADCASRGLHPSELVKNVTWFKGPAFLYKTEIKHGKPKNLETDLEIAKVHCSTVEEAPLERFSSLQRMKRVIAYCLRFADKLKKRHSSQSTELFSPKYLTSKELANALNVCIKLCQGLHFAEEIAKIKQNKDLPKNSKLRALNPYVDDEQILRVGGRLEHSNLSEARKHPIIIPQNSHMSELIISDAHRQTLHGGPQLMLNYIRSRYWILRAKQLVKSHYHDCVICVKNNAATHNPLMGQAPSSRVTPSRAFKCSGVDYAGPIQIRTTQGRGHKSHKGYICLFVCMATRAIHLEVVTDLSTQGFIQAFKRFVARRGPCLDLWSDNGTNFTGAANELKRLFKSEQQDLLQQIGEALAIHGCEWHFIPPHAPNFGGLWEAGVKSVKYHLKRVIGNTTLTYEEMSTVLAQIEACLNSRPLSIVTDDLDCEIVLTPGHFLVGEALVTAPDHNFESSSVSSLRRWQYTQRMMQEFWRRWSQEYLTKFLHRYRWSTQGRQINVGDIVIVKEDGLPPSRWLYGKVIATHAGQDKIVRVVTLKTQNGSIKRPTSKLCLLPISS